MWDAVKSGAPWSWIAIGIVGLGVCGVLFKVFS